MADTVEFVMLINKGYSIYADRSSFVKEGAEEFWENALDELERHNWNFKIDNETAVLLLGLSGRQSSFPSREEIPKTKIDQQRIQELIKNKTIIECNRILPRLERDIISQPVFLITQDEKQAKEALKLNIESNVRKNITTGRINQRGFLEKFEWDESGRFPFSEKELPVEKSFSPVPESSSQLPVVSVDNYTETKKAEKLPEEKEVPVRKPVITEATGTRQSGTIQQPADEKIPKPIDTKAKSFVSNETVESRKPDHIVCRICGNRVAKADCSKDICSKCLREGENYSCVVCGSPMKYTNEQKYIMNLPKQTICAKCKNNRISEQGKPAQNENKTAANNIPAMQKPAGAETKRYTYASKDESPKVISVRQKPAEKETGRYTYASKDKSPKVIPVRQEAHQVYQERSQKKSKTLAKPLWMTLVLSIVSLIALFVYRMDIMEWLFHNTAMLKNQGFIFEYVYPMVLLLIPWFFVNKCLFFIFCIFTGRSKQNPKNAKKPRRFYGVVGALFIVVLAVVVYALPIPGFDQPKPGKSGTIKREQSVQQTKEQSGIDLNTVNSVGVETETVKPETTAANTEATDNDKNKSLPDNGTKGKKKKSIATESYDDMTFIVEKKSNNTATLTIASETSNYWKFAPWAASETTVTLIRDDGAKSYAHIAQSSLFFNYSTGNFTKGRTFVFDLDFENDQNTAEWDEVTVEIASYLRTANVRLMFDPIE